ncbi:MAG: hypothetical protein HY881_14455 [Deltaproteobacteria bacterium]|nr:hypothetical protein [Deltaproteobacteria bacterium]
MTPKELDKRLDALENRILPKEMPSVWINFVGKDMEHMPVKGYRCGEHIFLREPDETDEDLENRVLLLSEQYKNPPNGQLFIPVI